MSLSTVAGSLELPPHDERTASARIAARRMPCRLTPQFSRGALTYVTWHFIHDRRLQLLVRRQARCCGLFTALRFEHHSPPLRHGSAHDNALIEKPLA